MVELSFAGTDWLVREVLKEAGDAVVLEPEDARDAVLAAVQRLRAVPAGRIVSRCVLIVTSTPSPAGLRR